MKKLRLRFSLILIMFFFSCLSFAQFNTITKNIDQKEKSIPKMEELQKTDNDQKGTVKKPENRKKLFNLTTKSELKREIDSLKKQILKLNLLKYGSKKLDYKKIEDSLIEIIKRRIENSQMINPTKSIKIFDFVNDSTESLTSKISMPLKGGINVNSSFGIRIHPISGTEKMHNGADLKANYKNVYAVLDGIVIESGWDSGGGGNYIKIRHSDTFVTSYLHLSEIYYQAGEKVRAGFIIAKSGNSGNSTGAHLHFSVTENGKYINPIHFLNDLIKANQLIATYYAK